MSFPIGHALGRLEPPDPDQRSGGWGILETAIDSEESHCQDISISG
jgi:hypothetical protein